MHNAVIAGIGVGAFATGIALGTAGSKKYIAIKQEIEEELGREITANEAREIIKDILVLKSKKNIINKIVKLAKREKVLDETDKKVNEFVGKLFGTTKDKANEMRKALAKLATWQVLKDKVAKAEKED